MTDRNCLHNECYSCHGTGIKPGGIPCNHELPRKCTCESCKNAPAEEPHTCPYAEEHDDYETLCNCCGYCTGQCSDDI